ncbi:MAG: hypothetical protein O7G30_11500, partial [Proteobacteria bacterium]|nr:hypothetical protein [Pseudomonadota bacterium]
MKQSAFVAVVAVWASELALARVTGEPQSPLDIGESLAGLCLLGVAPVVLFARWPTPGWLRSVLLGLTAAAPMALVAFGILVPVILRNVVIGAIGLAALLGVLCAWRIAAAHRRNAPFPGPLAAAAVVAAASLAVWLIKDAALPPLPLLAPLLALYAAIGLAARRTALVPVVMVAVALFA